MYFPERNPGTSSMDSQINNKNKYTNQHLKRYVSLLEKFPNNETDFQLLLTPSGDFQSVNYLLGSFFFSLNLVILETLPHWMVVSVFDNI